MPIFASLKSRLPSVPALLLGLSVAGGAAADDSYDIAADPWYVMGQQALEERLAVTPNTAQARNVIVFVADGMDITLVTVARILEGQLRGEPGEENFLSFERFPHAALVKTYSANSQISDSAATASAIMTGVKTRTGVVGVPSDVAVGDCAGAKRGVPPSLGELAASAGKATGVITTSMVVDATPATTYAHAPTRNWILPQWVEEQARASGCKDIALQLIESHVDVALGGGRAVFFEQDKPDPDDSGTVARREDGRDLVAEWLAKAPERSAYVETAAELAAVDPDRTDRLLGLFARTSMDPSWERGTEASNDPRLPRMVESAIRVLSKNQHGFFLLVETEETDDLQHQGYAKKGALGLIEFAEAVRTAAALVDLDETLIVVTADHGHTLTFGGDATKGNPVFGLARGNDEQGLGNVEPELAGDGKPFTTVGYKDGPGGYAPAPRPDLTDVDTSAIDYRPQAAIPSDYESHGGQDVPLWAAGPWSHLFSGTLEQQAIFHLVKHAMNPVSR